MKNKLFYTNKYKTFESRILNLLNTQKPEELGLNKSVREIGDRIGTFIADNFASILLTDGTNIVVDPAYKKACNVSFEDSDGFTYYVDVITHNIDAKFSMPNITSVQRLANLYEDDKKVFVILHISFKQNVMNNFVKKVTFIPIEFLSWECLTFGLLGKGQIQIKKSSDLKVLIKNSRKKWMIEFGKKLNRFYISAADKIVGQLKLSVKIEDTWDKKKDVWK